MWRVCYSCSSPLLCPKEARMLDRASRDKLDKMSTKELLEKFQANMRAVATAAQELLGDEPIPDPRVMVEAIDKITNEMWVAMFLDDATREAYHKQMPLMGVMAQVNDENLSIIARMLRLMQA